MLYQLSYASDAQTEQIYRSGNQIASGFLAPSKTIASTPLMLTPSASAMPYCAAGFANSESGNSTLWCTSLNFNVYVVSPFVWRHTNGILTLSTTR
jgi:hypothetical protein